MESSEIAKVTSFYIEFSNLPSEIEWSVAHAEFSQFGEILKLYIDSSRGTGFVHFKYQQNAEFAYNILKIHSNLGIIVNPPKTASLRAKVPNLRRADHYSETSSITSTEKSPTMSINGNNDFLASEAPGLYDAFGNSYTTFQDDDGTIYIPVSELDDHGIHLFDETSKLPHDRLLIEKFELYMKIKAGKFMYQNKFILDETVVNETIDRCKQDIFKNNQPQEQVDSTYRNFSKNVSRQGTREMPKKDHNDYYRKNHNRNRKYDGGNKKEGNPKNQYKPKNMHENQRNDNFPNYNINQTVNEVTNLRRPNSPIKPLLSLSVSNPSEVSHKAPVIKEDRKSPVKSQGTREEITSPIKSTSMRSVLAKSTEKINVTQPKETHISKVKLPLKKDCMVTIQHVENETVFWAVLDDNNEVFSKIVVEVLDEAEKAATVTPKIGGVYAANFERMWYRAEVKSIIPKLKVHFIDFGNNSVVKEVRQLSQELETLPGQAVKISLSVPCIKKVEVYDSINIRPISQEDDGSYVIEILSEGYTEKPSALGKPENVPSTFSAIKPKPSAPVPEIVKKSTPGSIIFHISKGDSGMIEVQDILDSNRFVAFIMLEKFANEVSDLDTIKSETILNKVVKGDVVAVMYSGNFVRGRVLDVKEGKYKVALLDYGIILETKECRELPDKFYKIPEFTCVCHVQNNGVVDDMQKSDGIDLTVISDKKIQLTYKPINSPEENTIEVTVEEWNPSKTVEVQASDRKYFWKDVPDVHVQDNTEVIIFSEKDGILMLRTRATSAKLREISNYLKDYDAKPLKRSPEVGELLLCVTDDTFYRAAVQGVNGEVVDVHYVDYGNFAQVSKKSLKTVDKTIAEFENTLIRTKLNGFENFDDVQVQELRKIKDEKEKFHTVLVKGKEEIELKSSATGEKLSERLQTLTKQKDEEVAASISPKVKATSTAITASNIRKTEFKEGKHQVICLGTDNINEGLVVMCDPNLDVLTDIQTCTNEYILTDPAPYKPTEECEIVLAYFEDDWYRAMKISEENGDYELVFIDFGNMSRVNYKQIRKLPPKLAEFPSIAKFCFLKGIDVENSKVLKRVREIIEPNSLYEVEFFEREEDDVYNISIPSLVETLKKENLM